MVTGSLRSSSHFASTMLDRAYFTFARPFLTTALIQYLLGNAASKNDGYGLMGASLLVYGGIAVNISSSCTSAIILNPELIPGVGLKQLVLSFDLQIHHDRSWRFGECGL